MEKQTLTNKFQNKLDMNVTAITTYMSELFKSQLVTHTRRENIERRNWFQSIGI